MSLKPYEMNDLERLTTEFVESLLDANIIDVDACDLGDKCDAGIHFASRSNSYNTRVRRFVEAFTEHIKEAQDV